MGLELINERFNVTPFRCGWAAFETIKSSEYYMVSLTFFYSDTLFLLFVRKVQDLYIWRCNRQSNNGGVELKLKYRVLFPWHVCTNYCCSRSYDFEIEVHYWTASDKERNRLPCLHYFHSEKAWRNIEAFFGRLEIKVESGSRLNLAYYTLYKRVRNKEKCRGLQNIANNISFNI